MSKVYIFLLLPIMASCQSNLDSQFSAENEKLINEWKSENKKFIEENRDKLSDAKMLQSLDSIVIEYTINKNKTLAVKYIKSKSGVKRLNFLKKNFSKEEVASLLKEIPESIKKDTNYIALKNYSNSK
ncbi:hypothetical protein [Flavobacterium sp. KJJ]|uniref:hypothetical protein n=1 Tax=Flavobacterium sp. KJJ TaxID=1270193 RepID=UPI0012FA2620|nr:hypothetical protein [Flavobacterium sp. KJJ]